MFKKDQLNELALPLMMSNVLSLVIGLCDQAMIGHISLSGFAAVGIVATFVNSVTGVLGATSVSFNILGAKVSDNKEKLSQYFVNHIVQSVGIGVVFLLLTWFFGEWFFKQIYNLQGEILQEALEYANVFSLSIGLNLIIFMFSSYLKIINETKYILIGSTTAAICNVILDYVFIYIFNYGILGNAIGSVLALIINLLIYVLILKPKIFKKKYRITLNLLKMSFKLSLPLMMQELLESTVITLVISSILSRIGLLEVAVHQLLSTIIGIAWMPMYAYGQATLTMSSQATMNLKELINKAIKRSMSGYLLIVIVFIIFRNPIISLMTNQLELVKSATYYLFIVCIVYALNIPLTIFTYLLQSIGEEQFTLKMTTKVYLIGFCVLSGIMTLTPNLLMLYFVLFDINLVLFVFYCRKINKLINY